MSFLDLTLKPEYRSRLDDVVNDFYTPVLNEAVMYKRAVGFFSSSALSAIALGIKGLLKNDGQIQIIASPRLSEEDIIAINEGLRKKDDVIKEALLRELQEPKGRFEELRLNLLCNLIAAGKLEIRIAFMDEEGEIGLFHEKLGLMIDKEDNVIAFSGSMNESETAFKINYEAFDVFTSWSHDADRVLSKQSAFTAMWNDYEPGIKVMSFPEISEELLTRYRRTDTIKSAIEEFDAPVVNEVSVNVEGPHVPTTVHIRPYQEKAILNWEQHNYQGIFDMATGAGKTYTALAAIAHLYKAIERNLAVIIICPYQHLVEQWKEDVEAFGMKPIICYSASSQKNWRDRLKNAVTSFNLGVKKHFCMLCTNATFSLDDVQQQMIKLQGNVVIVVDEAHNFGAEKLSRSLLQHFPYRLALSATIDRHGDPEGTQKLYDYFGEKCITYTLQEAIDSHMLTPYYYHPSVVALNETELQEYMDLTVKIRKNSHVLSDGKIELSEYAKMLLIKRARLVAGANGKLDALRNDIQEYKDQSHILVYCGATTLHDSDYSEKHPSQDEAKQIDIVVDMLGNQLGMRVSKFTSEEKSDERERIKEEFAEGKHLQALVAIRCLDEGVNIPNISTAFILASSTNPKEYVQRRGRVLRNSPGKQYAHIYDYITLPIPLDCVSQYDAETIEGVRSLAKREISRMVDFSSIAENPYESDQLISEIRQAYDIIPEMEDEYDEV